MICLFYLSEVMNRFKTPCSILLQVLSPTAFVVDLRVKTLKNRVTRKRARSRRVMTRSLLGFTKCVYHRLLWDTPEQRSGALTAPYVSSWLFRARKVRM